MSIRLCCLHQLTLKEIKSDLHIQLHMLYALSKGRRKKSKRDITSVYFLNSVILNLKFSFTDEYVKVLPVHINKYITRLSRPSTKVFKKVKLTVFTTESY